MAEIPLPPVLANHNITKEVPKLKEPIKTPVNASTLVQIRSLEHTAHSSYNTPVAVKAAATQLLATETETVATQETRPPWVQELLDGQKRAEEQFGQIQAEIKQMQIIHKNSVLNAVGSAMMPVPAIGTNGTVATSPPVSRDDLHSAHLQGGMDLSSVRTIMRSSEEDVDLTLSVYGLQLDAGADLEQKAGAVFRFIGGVQKIGIED